MPAILERPKGRHLGAVPSTVERPIASATGIRLPRPTAQMVQAFSPIRPTGRGTTRSTSFPVIGFWGDWGIESCLDGRRRGAGVVLVPVRYVDEASKWREGSRHASLAIRRGRRDAVSAPSDRRQASPQWRGSPYRQQKVIPSRKRTTQANARPFPNRAPRVGEPCDLCPCDQPREYTHSLVGYIYRFRLYRIVILRV